MAYTHTFEFETKNIGKIEGELDFTSKSNGYKITGGLEDFESNSKESTKLLELIKCIFGICGVCGEIEKIEINKKKD